METNTATNVKSEKSVDESTSLNIFKNMETNTATTEEPKNVGDESAALNISTNMKTDTATIVEPEKSVDESTSLNISKNMETNTATTEEPKNIGDESAALNISKNMETNTATIVEPEKSVDESTSLNISKNMETNTATTEEPKNTGDESAALNISTNMETDTATIVVPEISVDESTALNISTNMETDTASIVEPEKSVDESTALNISKNLQKKKLAPEEPENDINESALHIFKDFFVIDTYENDRHQSPVSHNPKSNVQEYKKSNDGSGKSHEKRHGKNVGNSNITQIGLRRDPEKTKRDIEKDKFIKATEDIVKKLESGLMPPGMETDITIKSDSSKHKSLSNVSISTKDPNMRIDKLTKKRKEMRDKDSSDNRERFFDRKQPSGDKYFRPTSPNYHDSFQNSSCTSRQFRREHESPNFDQQIDTQYTSDTSNRFRRTFKPTKLPSKPPEPFRRRLPQERLRSRQYSRSPVRAVFKDRYSREREDANFHRKPKHNLSRQRSTERFIQALIKTSGIQENSGNPMESEPINVQPDYSDPGNPSSADIFANFAPPIFLNGPPQAMSFPPPFPPFSVPPPELEFSHQIQPSPNMMLDNLPIGYYPNSADLQFNPAVPQFLPVQFPTFPPNVTPENPIYFPPPSIMEQEASYKEIVSLQTNEENKHLCIDIDSVTEDSVKLRKLSRVEAKLKVEIINRCQDAVEKLDNLHFPNRLIVPPSIHETLNDFKFTKLSPLRRQLPPCYNFTSKPNNIGEIILPSIISTIGLDEIIPPSYPVCSFSKQGQPMKDVSVQTNEFACDTCNLRRITLSKHTQTISARSYSVHSQVTGDDLMNSGTPFTPNQSAAQMQDKPVSLMHMTPAQILVAELAAKAKSFQRSTVEALQRAKLESGGNKDNGSSSASFNSGTTQQPTEKRGDNDNEYRDSTRQSRFRAPKKGSGYSGQSSLSREYEDFLRKIDYERQNSHLSRGRNIKRK